MRKMRLYGGGRGVIINPRYRRASVLRSLMANFRNPVEEDREESCNIVYLRGEGDSSSTEER